MAFDKNDIRAQALADVEIAFHSAQERLFLNAASQETRRSSRCPNIPAVPSIIVSGSTAPGMYRERTDMTQYGQILRHAPAASVVFKVASCKKGALFGKRERNVTESSIAN